MIYWLLPEKIPSVWSRSSPPFLSMATMGRKERCTIIACCSITNHVNYSCSDIRQVSSHFPSNTNIVKYQTISPKAPANAVVISIPTSILRILFEWIHGKEFAIAELHLTLSCWGCMSHAWTAWKSCWVSIYLRIVIPEKIITLQSIQRYGFHNNGCPLNPTLSDSPWIVWGLVGFTTNLAGLASSQRVLWCMGLCSERVNLLAGG